MDYKQVTQTSRPYEYGEQKEFKTKEEAIKAVEKVEQKLKTEMALNKTYPLSTVKRVEVEGAIQLVVETKIPNLFKNQKNED